MNSDFGDRDAAWVSQFLASRRSTRDFLPTPIPQEILDQILTDALTSPVATAILNGLVLDQLGAVSASVSI